MKKLWCPKLEEEFFTKYLKTVKIEKLFYHDEVNDKYYAYWPKSYKGEKDTLQSRNTHIGEYTEAWAAELLSEFAASKGWHIVQKAICDELFLSKASPADIAICKTSGKIQKPENIILIIKSRCLSYGIGNIYLTPGIKS